jgi:hypothetical protein
LWGAGSIPLLALGVANELWIMCAAVLIVGASESAATVIWGTLLQRRVPDGLRGRVSSLDFFVSLSLMPASMALAGPAGDAFGLTAVFVAAALVPALAAPIAFRAGRLGRDELAHPLS